MHTETIINNHIKQIERLYKKVSKEKGDTRYLIGKLNALVDLKRELRGHPPKPLR